MRGTYSLNGWWDFRPETDAALQSHHKPLDVPHGGWLDKAILVPGSWTRGSGNPTDAECENRPWLAWRISDNYGYPAEWHAMHTAWYRRTFEARVTPGTRHRLEFDGVLRCAWVFVNGRAAGHIAQGIMPATFDITSLLRDGANDLHVCVTEYPVDADGKTLVPAGLDQTIAQRGIWQDVRLVRHSDAWIEDVTIRTDVRNGTFTAILALRNDSAAPRCLRPRCAVRDAGADVFTLEGPELTVAAGASQAVTLERSWKDAIRWSPWTPHLYRAETSILESGATVDAHTERFGFREVWIDGPNVMLNDAPIRLYGDWCHKDGLENFRPEYIRQWFRMLKDCNMNYTRTHMFPHPRVLLDLADEMGILVSLESAFAFGGTFALDRPEFWAAAQQHVRDIVRRYKNHPSIILWSAGNEVRWSGNRPAIVKNYPRLMELARELDPTRIAYADGDSSLWDERTQSLRSRHYGNECTGEIGWDKSQPLHVGEVGNWHFAQPIDAGVWADDSVFASVMECHRAIARECADMAETARSNGVCSFFPWNLSGLDNFRPWPEERRFEWPDPAAPGIKPLRSAPYGSEFAWWDPDSPGYAPGPSFEIMRHAFRPMAVIVREKRSRFFDDQPVQHTVTLVNDTGGPVSATLTATYSEGRHVLWSWTESVTLKKGEILRGTMTVPAVAATTAGVRRIETVMSDPARLYDRHERHLQVTPAAERRRRLPIGPVALYGNDDGLLAALRDHRIAARPVASLAALDPARTPLLLVARDAIRPGSQDNRHLEQFLERGGRAVILEQSSSPLTCSDPAMKPVERCFIRGGHDDLLAGFTNSDFEFWGDDPCGLPESGSWVTVMPYSRPAVGNVRSLLAFTTGAFGAGSFQWTPLLEARHGRGIAIACQLLVSDKLATHPVARRLLLRMLEHAAAWKPAAWRAVSAHDAAACDLLRRRGARIPAAKKPAARGSLELISGKAVTVAAAAALARKVKAGATAVIVDVTAPAARRLSHAFGVDIRLHNLGPQYCLVRAASDPLLDGITNHESYWIEKGVYQSTTHPNAVIAETLIECPQGEALLVSEYESCWKEFFELGAGTEWLRMPVITHLLWNGPRTHAAALLRIRVGKGSLLLWQLREPEENNIRGRRLWNALLSNLGLQMDASPFAGDCVKAGGKKSDGHPGEVILLRDPPPGTLPAVVQASIPQGEVRLPNGMITASFEWADAKCPGGELTLDADAREVILAFQVAAGRPRKEVRRADGWPDPTMQTFLDFTGAGHVEVWINGKAYEPVDLGGELHGSVPDIDLEMHWNTVVVLWRPAGRTLRMAWRNRQGEPEFEFNFTGRGW